MGTALASKKRLRISTSEELRDETAPEVQPGALSSICRGTGHDGLRVLAFAAAKRQSGNHGECANHDGGRNCRTYLHGHADQTASRDTDEVFLSAAIGSGLLRQCVFQPVAKSVSGICVQRSHAESD